MLKEVQFRPKKILFTIGSPNQASQMHQIASLLPEYDCYFSQLYSKHPVIKWFMRRGYLENTILSGNFKKKGDSPMWARPRAPPMPRTSDNVVVDRATICPEYWREERRASIYTF